MLAYVSTNFFCKNIFKIDFYIVIIVSLNVFMCFILIDNYISILYYTLNNCRGLELFTV